MRLRGIGFGIGLVFLSALALFSQYAPYYVLDGYGGVHAGGGAMAISPATAYFGWNIARDLIYIPVATSDTNYGDGLLVLDGFGGIHKGGNLSTIPVAATPYFGWDIATAITFRRIDPQAYGTALAIYHDFTSLAWTQVIPESIDVMCPDAGYVLVTISCNMTNPDAGDTIPSGKTILGEISIGVNSTTSADTASTRHAALGDLRIDLGGGNYAHPSDCLSSTRIFYFPSGGTQKFYFLARRKWGTGTVRISYPSITCLYVNKRWDSYSEAASALPHPSSLALAPNSAVSDYSAIVKK